MFYEVIPTTVFRQDSGILTYSSDLKLQPGQIVVIPLGRRTTTGIVLRKVKAVDFPTKPIAQVLYDAPLPQHILKSILWLSEYYLAPLPLCANLFLPAGITKRRRKSTAENEGDGGSGILLGRVPRARLHGARALPLGSSLREAQENAAAPIPLNSAQQQALKVLVQTNSATRLLHGITGSGKTNIYLHLAQRALVQGQSTILLVPEIALTSQLVKVFEQTFAHQVTLIHSRQTEAKRHLTWKKILQSTQPRIIIGPRSALLAPVQQLGLIIIDEAHEPTYTQENPPKYSALRLASFMAKTLNIPCVQGTATPLVTDYYLAKEKHALVTLNTKAKQTATPTTVHLVDLKNRADFSKSRYFSDQLLANIKQNLTQHQQTLIFHNRRGSAPLTLCENCGWQALCSSCFLPLTLHTDRYELICHTCGLRQPIPKLCPTCQHPEIIHKGFGTKLLESELKKIFQSATIARFDGDNLKSETLDANFKNVQSGQVDIIIGTQTIARGLDLPKLATVGVVQADAGLNLPDYSAEERTYHLLTQVIGRVGRGHLAVADVFIQTFQPDHPVITAAVHNDYQKFANYLLKKRAQGHFPPWSYLAKITVTFKTEATTIRKIRALAQTLSLAKGLMVSTPLPAFHEQSRQGYTWQLVVKAVSRQTLLNHLKNLPNGSHFIIDPPSLL